MVIILKLLEPLLYHNKQQKNDSEVCKKVNSWALIMSSSLRKSQDTSCGQQKTSKFNESTNGKHNLVPHSLIYWND